MAENEKKKKRKPEWTFKNFEALLALPERLADYLRLWFHITKADWDFMVAKVRQGKSYTEWSRSKGRGKGRRYFAAPCAELKHVQKAVLNRFLGQIPVHFVRYGGQRGGSIFTNAERHAGFAKTVFAVDIVNAFPSVYRSRVRACLWKPFEFGFRQFAGVEFTPEERKQMLETVVDLLVWKDRLPQGPPTSPRVFDIVCGKMDQGLFELVHKNSTPFQEYRLSVYADNITISSSGDIPEEVRGQAVKVIRENGFFTHARPDKMQYFSPETGTVPVITGLVVLADGRVLMHPNKVNQIRGRLTRLLKQEPWDKTVRGEAAGLVGFVRQVYPADAKKLPSKLRKVVPEAEVRMKLRPAQVAGEAEIGAAPSVALYTDGSSKGNPGPASIGFVLLREGKRIASVSEAIGTATNNEAEYRALIAGLTAAKEQGVSGVVCFLDSELVVHHLTGASRVGANLKGLYDEAKALADEVKAELRFVGREKNTEAHALAEKAQRVRGKKKPRNASGGKNGHSKDFVLESTEAMVTA